MSPRRVLLTGATGFIGQRLQKALLEAGFELTALIRPSSRRSARLAPRCRRIEAELADSAKLAPLLPEFDAVIYAAGSVRGRGIEDFQAANVDGVAGLVELLNRAESEQPFLLVSSLAASRPELSDYAASKRAGEDALGESARFPWTIFRPPAVYGPGDREMRPILRMASRGLLARPGPAPQRLSLIHVDDLARAVLAWLEHWDACRGRSFTLDDGRPGGYDWESIGRAAGSRQPRILGIPRPLLGATARLNLLASRLLGYSPMLTPGKVRELTQDDWLCDNSALSRATGWTPAIDLETGLRRLFNPGGSS
ncbi:MAG: NAD(P)-dependent oxidoreductase [Xanthomonadales bacterium]|nr:NAD(P)-dependent oxidoreductase [Xanthomonadales bacterium]